MKLILLLFAILSSLQLSAQEPPHDLPYLKVYNGLTDTHHMMGEQALWHYRNHQYAEAENYFRYYMVGIDKDDLSSFDREVLYAYAYNRFFQGDEENGMKLLKFVGEKYYGPAYDDYQILKDCRTIGYDIKEEKTHQMDFDQTRQRYAYLAEIDIEYPAEFWEEVRHHNKSLNEIMTLVEKKQAPKTLLRATASIVQAESPMMEYLQECHPNLPGDLEQDLTSTLFEKQNSIQELRVYPAQEPNAFATPYGQIYLTNALVRLYHSNRTLLSAICAHEATHYFCQHSLVAQWNQEKKEQKNKVLAGIAIGLGSVLQIASGALGSSADFSSLGNSIIDICTLDSFYFQYRYGREQEIEADIAAYRFCEATGIGGYAYIMALQLLGNGTGYMKAAKTSDHPTNNYRVSLLKYIYQKEHPQHRHAPLPGQMLVSCQ